MQFPSWLRPLASLLGRAPIRRKPASHVRAFRPGLERLEDRCVPATFTVTNTLDAGAGSLRQAITDANTTVNVGAPNLINFNIPTTDTGYQPATNSFRIQPLTSLPGVGYDSASQTGQSVIIDGYSQPGAQQNTLSGVGTLGVAPGVSSLYGDNAVLKIELDGSLIPSGQASYGLVVGDYSASPNPAVTTVQGLDIHSFATGILPYNGPVIQGNFIGTDITGTTTFPHTYNVGIYGTGGSAQIGGTTPQSRNLISGWNVGIEDDALYIPSKWVVQGNFIGTDHNGTSGANGGNNVGVWDFYSAPMLLGGPLPGEGNLISGNGIGIQNNGGQSGGPFVVQGNYIGTDVTGTQAVGNSEFGVFVNGLVVIGGKGTGDGNLINGGVAVGAVPGTPVLIQGNFIDTDVTGNVNFGGQTGVYFYPGTGPGVVVGGDDSTLGALIDPATGNLMPAVGNLISGNTGVGVNGATGGVVEHNTFFHTSTGVALYGGSGFSITDNVYDDVGTAVSLSNSSGNLIEGETVNIGNGVQDSTGHNNTIRDSIFTGGSTPTIGDYEGVFLRDGTSGDVIENNTFQYAAYGVRIDSGTGNSILGNSIHDNGVLGIYLNSANNANDNQAAPVLTAVGGSAASPTISGTLASIANTTFRIEFFANPHPVNLANTEGQTLLGSVYVTTDATGTASFTASGLAAIPPGQGYLTATATVATAVNSSYTYGDTSQFSPYFFAYFFGGFQAPLSQGLSFAVNRVIPIRFQLTDLSGTVVTSLSAVSSLQVAAVNADGSLGTPFTPASAGNTGLSVHGSTYAFNWQTKGLAAGTYEILLTLADGTVQTKVLQLTKAGSSAGLTTVAAGGTGSAPGGLLGGNIELYVVNSNGDLTADELARIQAVVTAVDAVTEPYGVVVEEVTDPTQADVTLNMDTTSAVGGYADGVLGCTTDAGQITLITGWNFYAGADATQIGSAQYDFQTVVTHELGHALGLGHSTDSTSVMYATLNTGTVNRSLTTADLNVRDSDTTGACGLHAVPSHPALTSGGGFETVSAAASGMTASFRSAPLANDSARNLLFALLGSERFQGGGEALASGLPSLAAQDAAFARFLAEGSGSQSFAPLTRVMATNSSPLFAAQPPRKPDDMLVELSPFPDSMQDAHDGANLNSCGADAADTIAAFITADPDSLND